MPSSAKVDGVGAILELPQRGKFMNPKDLGHFLKC
jgi:hypothetical protein